MASKACALLRASTTTSKEGQHSLLLPLDGGMSVGCVLPLPLEWWLLERPPRTGSNVVGKLTRNDEDHVPQVHALTRTILEPLVAVDVGNLSL